MTNFPDWLANELTKRDISPSELARLSNKSPAVITRILNGERRPAPETIEAIAHALRLPPETVFRAAGLLPPLPPEDAEWEIWREKLEQLTPENRQRFRRIMEAEIDYQTQQENQEAARKRGKTGPLPSLS